MPNGDILQEYDHLKECTPIPDTAKTYKIVRNYTSKGVACNKFLYLSINEEPNFVQWYYFDCCHSKNKVDDNNKVVFRTFFKVYFQHLQKLSDGKCLFQ